MGSPPLSIHINISLIICSSINIYFKFIFFYYSVCGFFFRPTTVSTQFERYSADARKVSEFNRGFSNIEIKFLERFDKITASCVDEWMDDDLRLFSHLNDLGKRDLRDEIEAKLGGINELPMKSWSEQAAAVLEARGIGIEGK